MSGRVVVIERDDTHSRASSSLAMGGIRQQFTLAANVRMVQYSVEFYRELDRMSWPDETHRVDFRQRGNCFDASCHARWDYRFPMVIDPSGVHWRHDDSLPGLPDRVVVARTNPHERPAENFTCDHSRWSAEFQPPLVRRMPLFAGLTPVEGWAGLYEMTPDHSPIIGEHPEVGGLFLANGFSGHGLMMAPATGRAVAELVAGTPRTIDVGMFRFDRFSSGALLPTDATI